MDGWKEEGGSKRSGTNERGDLAGNGGSDGWQHSFFFYFVVSSVVLFICLRQILMLYFIFRLNSLPITISYLIFKTFQYHTLFSNLFQYHTFRLLIFWLNADETHLLLKN